MSGNLKQKLTRPSIWMRLVYMIVLAIAFNVAELVIFAVVVFQFLVSLFIGKPNARLTRLGSNLARYVQQIVNFMTFATSERPFPFSAWPNEPQKEPVVENDEPMSSKPEEVETVTEEAEAGKPKKPTNRRTSAASKANQSAAASKTSQSKKQPTSRKPKTTTAAGKAKSSATRKPRTPPKKDT